MARLPAEWTFERPHLLGQSSPASAAELVTGRSHLVGYSMGGRLALWIAVRHPERVLSVTTIGAHAGLEPGERAQRAAADAALAERIEREGMDWFATYWAAQPMFSRLEAIPFRQYPEAGKWLSRALADRRERFWAVVEELLRGDAVKPGA